jgi:hypothetical protein
MSTLVHWYSTVTLSKGSTSQNLTAGEILLGHYTKHVAIWIFRDVAVHSHQNKVLIM